MSISRPFPPDGGHLPKAFLDAVPCALIVTDPDGGIVDGNAGAEALLGCAAEQLQGRNLFELAGAERRFPEGTEDTWCWKRGDGSSLQLSVSAGRIGSVGGPAGGFIFSLRSAPQSVRQGPAGGGDGCFDGNLLEAQSVAGIGSWAFDASTERIYWSDATFRLYGMDPAAGEPSFEELVRHKHPDDRERFRAMVYGAIENGREYNVDNRILRPDGTVCHIHTVARPFRNSDGVVVGLVGTALDITDRKKTELALRASERRFRTAFENEAIGMAMTSISDGRFLQVNGALSEITGYSEAELLSLKFPEITHSDDLELNLRLARELVHGERSNFKLEKRFVRRDGSHVWTRISVSLMRAEDGTPEHYIALIEDISERKRAQERWQLALQGANDGLFDWDAVSNRIFFSARWKEMLGFSDSELPNEVGVWESLVHPDDLAMAQEAVQNHLDGKTEHYVAEYRIRCKDGSYKWVLARAKAVRDENGHPVRMIGAHSDITARKLAEELLRFKAAHDQLTGIASRGYFLERFEELVQAAALSGEPCCLCVCDIDHFKSVNDSYGHQAGDDVLVHFAGLLSDSCGRNHMVGRLGGDEFHFVMPNTSRSEAVGIVENLRLRLIAKEFESPKGRFTVTASFGVAERTAGAGTAADAIALTEAADQALYQAKELGRNCVHALVPTPGPGGVPKGWTRVQMEAALRSAVEQGRISVEYQPEYRVPDGTLACFEALARWTDPVVGTVAPGIFIPLAERTGLIVPLGRIVMEESCRRAAAWQAAAGKSVAVAVNVSALQLSREDFVPTVRAILARTGLSPCGLKLELTESALLAAVEETVRKMEELRALGVEFLIDDFGTGYSCLSYLGKLPFSALKIDKSFVHELDRGQYSRRMVSTLVTLAHEFGMSVIAEGIETPEQFLAVTDCGCNQAQGYALGYPTAAPEALLAGPCPDLLRAG